MEEDPLQIILCTNCADSAGSIYIECDECQKTTVNLCVQCFASGAECGLHKRTHNYRVRNNGGVTIFNALPNNAQPESSFDTNEDESNQTSTSNKSNRHYAHPWCAKEEVRLLEAVERYNLGNFEDVTNLVNPRRNIADIKSHYDRYYLRGRVGQLSCHGFHRPNIVDETPDDSTRSGKPQTSWFSPPIKDSVCKVGQDDLRLLAYMPYRDDFEKEFKNDAEEIVSKLLLAPDDDQLDTDVKLAIVDMYVRIVKDRRKMKALVRDYDLVPQFFKQEKPSKKINFFPQSPAVARAVKREKELRESLRKFAQLITADKFNDLISSLIKEQRLKARIEELQNYQKQGITTLEEASAFAVATRRYNAPIKVNRTMKERAPTTSVQKPFLVKVNANGKRVKRPRSDVVLANDSKIPTEKPICDGSASNVGRKSSLMDCQPLPVANEQSNVKSIVKLESDEIINPISAKNSLLTLDESYFCTKHMLHPADYILVKMTLLKDSQNRKLGVPLRTNIREDAQNLKDLVRPFLTTLGLLDCFGE